LRSLEQFPPPAFSTTCRAHHDQGGWRAAPPRAYLLRRMNSVGQAVAHCACSSLNSSTIGPGTPHVDALAARQHDAIFGSTHHRAAHRDRWPLARRIHADLGTGMVGSRPTSLIALRTPLASSYDSARVLHTEGPLGDDVARPTSADSATPRRTDLKQRSSGLRVCGTASMALKRRPWMLRSGWAGHTIGPSDEISRTSGASQAGSLAGNVFADHPTKPTSRPCAPCEADAIDRLDMSDCVARTPRLYRNHTFDVVRHHNRLIRLRSWLRSVLSVRRRRSHQRVMYVSASVKPARTGPPCSASCLSM